MLKYRKSESFRQGLLSGINASFCVFNGSKLIVSYKHYDTVGRSWREVGEELTHSMKTIGLSIDQSSLDTKEESFER
jgi:hypothetical protein